MSAKEKILEFLKSVPNKSDKLNFFEPNRLEEEQIGYSINPNGKSLISSDSGSWQPEWIVIGNDDLGDPIIVDTNTASLKVLSAPHGEGSWTPFVIADSLDSLTNIINLVFPDIPNNPAVNAPLRKESSFRDLEKVLEVIEKENPSAEVWYWENLLDDD